jgi:hypothetical protein
MAVGNAPAAQLKAVRQAITGGSSMRNLISITFTVLYAALAVSCSPGRMSATSSAFSSSPSADGQQAQLLITSTAESAPACSPASGEGTVAPTITIHSITFLVDGAELTLSDEDVIPAPPGSEVRVVDVVICVGDFVTNSGQACVDFAPTDQSGEEISAEHVGTHLVPLAPGLIKVPGPDHLWSIDESWVGIAAVVNHWPGMNTKDYACAEGQCEQDYQLILPLR